MGKTQQDTSLPLQGEVFLSQINMITPRFIYGLGQRKDTKKEFQDNQIVEQYEGECEECEREVQEKVCPICKG